jgi:hypothetical protein
MFAAGFALIVFGGVVLLAFGDLASFGAAPPAPILAGKWTGVVIVLAGAGLSSGSAIRLYVIGNRRGK